MNPAFPQNLWENNFSTKEDKVQVDITLIFDTLANLDKTIEIGFKGGLLWACKTWTNY